MRGYRCPVGATDHHRSRRAGRGPHRGRHRRWLTASVRRMPNRHHVDAWAGRGESCRASWCRASWEASSSRWVFTEVNPSNPLCAVVSVAAGESRLWARRMTSTSSTTIAACAMTAHDRPAPRLPADPPEVASVAADLAAEHTVLCPDLRGYGAGDKPAAVSADIYPMRTMAADMTSCVAYTPSNSAPPRV